MRHVFGSWTLVWRFMTKAMLLGAMHTIKILVQMLKSWWPSCTSWWGVVLVCFNHFCFSHKQVKLCQKGKTLAVIPKDRFKFRLDLEKTYVCARKLRRSSISRSFYGTFWSQSKPLHTPSTPPNCFKRHINHSKCIPECTIIIIMHFHSIFAHRHEYNYCAI